MELQERLEILTRSFSIAMRDGLVTNKKEYAEMIGSNKSVISAAFNGNPAYLTESLVAKVQRFDAKNSAPQSDSILVIPTGARAGSLGDFNDSITEYECERIVSPIKGADFAMQVTGDSMSPEFPSGSMVIIKKVESIIEWGKTYVLDTCDGAIIKQVYPTEQEDMIECRSVNPAYHPFKVKSSCINGWYRVLMVMSFK